MKSCIKKLYKCLKKDANIRFIVCYKTTKMSFYTNTKDKTLFKRTEEHAYPSKKKNDQSAIFEHLSTCTHYDHIWDLFNSNINDVIEENLTLFKLGTIQLYQTDVTTGMNYYSRKY